MPKKGIKLKFKPTVSDSFEKNTTTQVLDDYESGYARYKGIQVTYTKIGKVVTLSYVIRENQRKTKITSLPYPLNKKLIRKKRK